MPRIYIVNGVTEVDVELAEFDAIGTQFNQVWEERDHEVRFAILKSQLRSVAGEGLDDPLTEENTEWDRSLPVERENRMDVIYELVSTTEPGRDSYAYIAVSRVDL